MTQDSPSNDPITTVDAFDSALGELLETAAENDIDPRGAWEYRNGDELPDWEVTVVELEKPEPTD